MPNPMGPLRRHRISDALVAQTEALCIADECFVRMVIWTGFMFVSLTFVGIFDWVFVFPALLFAGAWVSSAQTREIQLKCAANWQKYIDNENDEENDK
jgi:hypothetical protein